MSSNDAPPRSPSSHSIPGLYSPSRTQEASSSRPRPTSSGETYAQIAASATRPLLAPDNWSADDIDRADHLDSLSSYEGILQGHNWPIAPLPRPRQRELNVPRSAQTISLDEILDNQLRTDNNASSSNIDVPSNPPLLPPPSRNSRLSTDRWPSESIAGDVRRIFGDTAQTYTSLRDRVDRFESVLRDSNGTAPGRTSSISRGDTIIPAPPTDQPVRRRRNPRILSRPLDSDEPHPAFLDMDIDPSFPASTREEAPWRTVHIHPNIDLQAGAADMEEEEEDDEEGYDDYTDMFPSQRAGEVAQLRRGGNNRPRIRQRVGMDTMASETMLDHVRMYGTPGDIVGRLARRAVTLHRPSRGGMTPTNGEVEMAETIRSSVDRGVRSRSPSFSPSHPAKRRRVTPNPGHINTQAMVRPSYLKYTTLPESTILPNAFQPPERHSHLALTTHRPTPSSSTYTNLPTALPSPSIPASSPASSFPAPSSSASPSPPRPLISFTVHPPPSSTDADACSLRTLHPIPPGIGLYYFEAEVIDSGKEGYMSIGYMRAGVNMGRLVGWEKGSWGWHADDGRAFEGSGVGREFGPGWGVGDIVGAGVDYTTGRGFFTKNGKLIGHIFTNLPQGLHPAIGLRNPLESIAVNLTGPFVYDIDQHVMKIRDDMMKGLQDRPVVKIPRITAMSASSEKSSKADRPTSEIEEVASKSCLPFGVVLPRSTGKRTEETSTHINTVQEKQIPILAPETAFTGPTDKTITALVLDHLSHSGLEKVKSLVLRDLSRRKIIPEPLVSVPEDKPMVRIIEICDTIERGGRVPWNQVAELARSSGDEQAGGQEEEVAEVDEGMRRKLRILDLVAMLLPGQPPSLSCSDQPLPAVGDTAEDAIMSEEVSNTAPTDELERKASDDYLSESAISEGKRLLAGSTTESWMPEEKRWLSEAFGLISGSADDSLWKERREAWSKELKESLKAKQGLKATSYLQQAYSSTGRVLDLLIEKGDGGAAFVDLIAFVREHGKPVGKGEPKGATAGGVVAE